MVFRYRESMKAASFMASVIAAAVALAACGEKDESPPKSNATDATGAGPGAGSGGAGGGAGSGGGGGSSGTGTTRIEKGQQACLDICHELETNDCGAVPDCGELCEGQFGSAGPCADELAELYLCWYANAVPGECTLPPSACDAQYEAYEECRDQHGCGEVMCYSGGSTGTGTMDCGCETTCGGRKLETTCSGSSCECFVDGASVGMCDASDGDPCDIESGCCSELFGL